MFDDLTLSRFWSKVDKSAGDEACWPWMASLSQKGYGYFWADGRVTYGHRVSFQIHNQPISEGMMVDHICRNRACVNPSHLREVDNRVNTLENSISVPAKNAAKIECSKGHVFDTDNTGYYTDRYGRTCRFCKECKRASYQRAKDRAAIARNALNAEAEA